MRLRERKGGERRGRLEVFRGSRDVRKVGKMLWRQRRREKKDGLDM